MAHSITTKAFTLLLLLLFSILTPTLALPITPPPALLDPKLIERMSTINCEALYSDESNLSTAVKASKISWCKATIERRVEGERTRMGTAWRRSLEVED